KLLRNLTDAEIIAQVYQAIRPDFPLKASKPRTLTNIVYMGQGEPLLNFRNVAKAVRFVNSTFNLSPFRTTISTSGVAPLMKKVGQDLGAGLALSLHAVTDELRDELVPLNRQYPIKDVLKGCSEYLESIKDRARGQRRVTFEYVMLHDINDTDADAKELRRLLSHIPSHVNLIPFNPWPGSSYTASSGPRIHAFQQILKAAGIPTHIRAPRGQDILAACGQLASSNEKKKLVLS
ncbi:hypothetical protein HDU91_003928, partial [Kappamyces sp. JEL0680]